MIDAKYLSTNKVAYTFPRSPLPTYVFPFPSPLIRIRRCSRRSFFGTIRVNTSRLFISVGTREKKVKVSATQMVEKKRLEK